MGFKKYFKKFKNNNLFKFRKKISLIIFYNKSVNKQKI